MLITEPETYDGITTIGDFEEFARSLGNPIPLESGAFVKQLKVTTSELARANSLSSRYGTGSFPFHTDTAFWRTPARLVLLRGVGGNLSRPTLVTPFAPIVEQISIQKLKQGAWICDKGRRKTYTTIFFEHEGLSGMRYDPSCMIPANKPAQEADEILRSRCFNIEGETIDWIEGRVAVIPNWSYLHARESFKSEDCSRLIERIYIY